jgi:hypothetical protein
MAAAAKGGFFYFRGLQSGTTYMRAGLNEDVLQTLMRWDSGGGVPATTKGSDFITFPEDVQLYDITTITGITDTKQIKLLADYSPTNYNFYWEAHLSTLNNRPSINVGFKRGTRISAISTA